MHGLADLCYSFELVSSPVEFWLKQGGGPGAGQSQVLGADTGPAHRTIPGGRVERPARRCFRRRNKREARQLERGRTRGRREFTSESGAAGEPATNVYLSQPI